MIAALAHPVGIVVIVRSHLHVAVVSEAEHTRVSALHVWLVRETEVCEPLIRRTSHHHPTLFQVTDGTPPKIVRELGRHAAHPETGNKRLVQDRAADQ